MWCWVERGWEGGQRRGDTGVTLESRRLAIRSFSIRTNTSLEHWRSSLLLNHSKVSRISSCQEEWGVIILPRKRWKEGGHLAEKQARYDLQHHRPGGHLIEEGLIEGYVDKRQ